MKKIEIKQTKTIEFNDIDSICLYPMNNDNWQLCIFSEGNQYALGHGTLEEMIVLQQTYFIENN